MHSPSDVVIFLIGFNMADLMGGGEQCRLVDKNCLLYILTNQKASITNFSILSNLVILTSAVLFVINQYKHSR